MKDFETTASGVEGKLGGRGIESKGKELKDMDNSVVTVVGREYKGHNGNGKYNEDYITKRL